jgi:exodeoxyribonuclease VII large subunit
LIPLTCYLSIPSIFTVSRLNQTVRLLLEQEMGQVWISGEISNFTSPLPATGTSP